EEGILAFHAGTKMGPDPRKKDRWAKLKKELLIEQQRNDTLLTAGGRVLTLVACGPTMREAREKVYRNVDRVAFDGRHYRKDIALRELSAISDQPPA
ncbi:MAG: phosphoribosylglycinamide synthetase C domain-containing protein, partial [Chloroflexota bacterium]